MRITVPCAFHHLCKRRHPQLNPEWLNIFPRSQFSPLSLSLRLSTSLLSLRILQSTARIAVRCALHRQLAAPLIVAHAKTSIAECGARRLAKYRAWKHGLATSRASYAAARLGRCGKAPSSLSFSPSPSPSFPLPISPSPSLPLPLPLSLSLSPQDAARPRELHAPGAPRRPRSAERERESGRHNLAQHIKLLSPRI